MTALGSGRFVSGIARTIRAMLALVVFFPGLLHATPEASLLLAPKPERVRLGNAFYEVVQPSLLAGDTQRARAFSDRRALERADSLRLEQRLLEQQHLVGDLLEVVEGLKKDLRRSRPDIAQAFPQSSLDSLRTFLYIENRDSLVRARIIVDVGSFAAEPVRERLLVSSGEQDRITTERDRPDITFSGVNGPLLQHLKYLEWSADRLEATISMMLGSVEGNKRVREWQERLLDWAGRAIDEREFRRANHLLRLVRVTLPEGALTLDALLAFTSIRSGDVHPEDVPWSVPPVSMDHLVLAGDSLLRPMQDVALDLAIQTYPSATSLAWLNRIAHDSPNGPSAALLIAKQHRSAGKIQEAEAALQAVASINQNRYKGEASEHYAQVLIALGQIQADSGRLQQAVDSWRRVDRRSKHHAQATISAAWVALNRGNLAAVREWAGEVVHEEGESLAGFEAALLIDLASGDRERWVERLEQLDGLDAFLNAIRHLEAAEQLLTDLDAMNDQVILIGRDADIAELHRLRRVGRKIQSASIAAASSSVPNGLIFDAPHTETILHLFELEQLLDAGIREAEFMALERAAEQLRVRIERMDSPPPSEDWMWADRIQTARLVRDQATRTKVEPFRALRWAEPLVRLRHVLRTALLFDGERYQFDPSTVPSRELIAQAEVLKARLDSLGSSGQPGLVDVVAQGLLWRGDLLRMAYSQGETSGLEAAGASYQAIDSLSASEELQALALDRNAALDLVTGDHQRLKRLRTTVDTLRARYPASSALAHAELLAAEAWMSEKRPQYDNALLELERALSRPGNRYRKETLYLTGWCALRLQQPQRSRALRAFDQALIDGQMDDNQVLRRELVRELAGAFAPPFVTSPEEGFALAEEFFQRIWKRVPEYGFEFYLKLGDLYLAELGDEVSAQHAFDICRGGFAGEQRALTLEMTGLRLEDRLDGDPVGAFARRLSLAHRYQQLDKTGPALDSLFVQRMVEAISLAASEVSKQKQDSSWVARLNEAADLLAEGSVPQEKIARALFLRAATLERFAASLTSSKTLLGYYRTIALSYPTSTVAGPAMQRAYALLYNAIGEESEQADSQLLNPAELTHIALLLADRFPEDSRTPSLLLHAAASTNGPRSDALLDTVAARFPDGEAALNATKLWFKRKLASKRYDEVSRRALSLLAESPGRRVREVAAGAYAEASYELAQPYAKSGNIEKALQLYRGGAEVGKGTELAPTLLYQAGLLAAEAGRKEQARDFFQELVEWYPDSPQVASASFNLALTMGQLEGVDLLGSSDEAGPEEIARAFEEAYRSDSTSTHAASFLVNAAENYRVGGMPFNELRNRLALMRSFPTVHGAYGNAVRCLELASGEGFDPAIGESARFLVEFFPDSAQTVVAWYRLGMLGDRPEPFQHAIDLQSALEKTSKPGQPAYADAARVALLDQEVSAIIDWDPQGQLLDQAKLKQELNQLDELYDKYNKYGTLPSAAGVISRAHLACLLVAQGRWIVNLISFNPSNPGEVEAVAKYESALEQAFDLKSKALNQVTAAVSQLAELEKRHQQAAREKYNGQSDADPFGVRLLEEYLPEGQQAGALLRSWSDTLRTEMAHQVMDAAFAYHQLASAVEGDPLERLLVQLEGMRNIVSPRLLIAINLPSRTLQQGGPHPTLLNRLPTFYADSVAMKCMEETWNPRLRALLTSITSAGRKPPAVLQEMQASADSLNDLQDAILSTVDESTLMLAQIHDSLGRSEVLDSLILDRASILLGLARAFDRAADRCGRELADLESRAGNQVSTAMQMGMALMRDQQRAWEHGAIRVLESIWVLIDLDRYADHEVVHELATQLVIHDPAGYTSLFDLPRERTVVLSDGSWYFTVDGQGVLDRIGMEEGQWTEPNPGAEIPKMIQASFPGDTLVAETSLEINGLVVSASMEITASCRYEVFVNGSYVAESLQSPDLTGVPDVWELRTQLNGGHNSVQVLLEDDRPVGMMARIIVTTVPEPTSDMPIRTDGGYGGRE